MYYSTLSVMPTPLACTLDLVPPAFSGITGLAPQADGSLIAAWSAGTDTLSPPVRYRVFIQKSSESASTLFNDANKLCDVYGLEHRIYTDAIGNPLSEAETYRAGVRALDQQGNISQNTESLTAISLGVPSATLAEASRLLGLALRANAGCTVEAEVDSESSVEANTETLEIESEAELEDDVSNC